MGWKNADNGQMKRNSYPTDLTDDQSVPIASQIPRQERDVRPCKVAMRRVANGLLYRSRTDYRWRALPNDFPPRGTVAYYFYRFPDAGTWQLLHDRLSERVRVAADKAPTPSAAIIDSQSVKTTGKRRSAAGEEVDGRKRHLVVDTLGVILAVVVHAGRVQNRDGTKRTLAGSWDGFPARA
jgi:putative transposase